MQQARVLEIKDEASFKEELEELGTDKSGINIMAPKSQYYLIKLKDIPLKAALILKQEMLSKGGEVALPREGAGLQVEETDLILMGTRSIYKKVEKVLRQQPFGLREIGELILETLDSYQSELGSISGSNYEFNFGKRTYIMGILNVTPDSFSDGGEYNDFDTAVERAQEMIDNGADIIDIGGESTRPGSDPLPLEEELERVIPVIEYLTPRIDVPISVDTYKSEVGRRALEAGADIINDITGFKEDPKLAEVAAEYDAPVILMHIQGRPKICSRIPVMKI